MNGDAIVRVDSVSRIFADRAAVCEFALDVPRGEFLSILGPSGCGKTTLLRMLAGLDFPDLGRILLDGRDVTYVPAHRRPVNLVFQRVTLFPHLDVAENVAFGLTLKRMDKKEVAERVDRVLELVRLPGFEKRQVQTISGGEAQRVALARALVNRPKVLLLDEPLSSLDLQIRRQLQVELKDIHRETGGTFIYVTHDQEEAMSMSDRVVVMNQGRIVQVGSPIEIYREPACVFAASFVGSSNLWEGDVAEVAADRCVVDVDGTRVAAHPTADLVTGEHVWVLLRPESLVLARSAPAVPDGSSVQGRIEDVRFVGSLVHYRVALPRRTLVASHQPENRRLFTEGEDVVVTWRPDDVLVLKE